MDKAACFDAQEQFDPRQIRLADIDGCGTTDIIYLATNGVAIYHNQSGNSWTDQVLLSDFPAANSASSVSVVDLLGSGTACLVWSSPLGSDAGRQMRYINLMGAVNPHLFVRIPTTLRP